jgi:microcystin-dependent protein|tara:strand:+ start:887 stop:2215 length:1329 start_codon:yes stop_codon:yes gene_type:complete
MPSTYTANAGIELPANGEQSATWGNTVNDNMNIIDRLTNGVGAITLSGTTHTLTTSDGTVSDGHYNVLVLGGSPSGTNTITVAPNDGQHVYIVTNSSGQTAIFTQGSGGNVTVLNGGSKVIYCDGAGSGAAVVDVTAVLELTQLILGGTLVTSTGAELNILDGVTASTTELNILDGVTASTTELNILDGVTSTAAELNILDGVTASTTELNILDGVTASTSELNILDGVTSTASELNILNGVTASTAELNILDGVTATAAELNYVDGVTSAIQAQLDALTAATASAVPAGAVNSFAMSAVPTGWLSCNGSLVSRTTYSGLFSAVGTTYGAGDGSTTFALPDLRGEFIRGFDDGRGVDSGRTFGSAQSWAIENIVGTFTDIRVRLNTIFTATGAFTGSTGAVSGDNGSGGAATANFAFDASNVVNTASETRPRNIALLYCIKT